MTQPLPYRAIWERELRAGLYGQDRMRPSTWRMDALYRAVCWQIKSEETEDGLAVALDQGAHPDSIAKWVRRVHIERRMAHEIFLEHTRRHEAA